MAFLDRLFGQHTDPRDDLRPLYLAIVATARTPAWYHDGAPDTLDGRFDMIAAILAQVMLRLEAAGGLDKESTLLAELFVQDMDGQLREIGIGDMLVGKHIGRMMAALGGRLGAYRDADEDVPALANALERNLWRGEGASDGAALRVATRMANWRAMLTQIAAPDVLVGALPPVPG